MYSFIFKVLSLSFFKFIIESVLLDDILSMQIQI